MVECLTVYFIPYFVNSSGTKIPFLPAFCCVRVEPYEGTVGYFYWRKRASMTLTQNQLNPTIPPSQAEAIGEKVFFDYLNQKFGPIEGVLTVDAVIDPTQGIICEDDSWWPERLAIGIAKTGELKLMYLLEAIIRDATTGEEVGYWMFSIDAHTGEILFDEPCGGSWELLPRVKKRFIINIIARFCYWLAFIIGFILLSIFIITSFIRKRDLQHHFRIRYNMCTKEEGFGDGQHILNGWQ